MLENEENWKEHRKLFVYVAIGLIILLLIAIAIYLIIVSVIDKNRNSTSHDQSACKKGSTYFLPLEIGTTLNNISIAISGIINFTTGQPVNLGTYFTNPITTDGTQQVAYYDPKSKQLIIYIPDGITNPSIMPPPNIDPVLGSPVILEALVCANAATSCKASDIITYKYKGTIWPTEPYNKNKKIGTFSLNTFSVAGNDTSLVLVSASGCKM